MTSDRMFLGALVNAYSIPVTETKISANDIRMGLEAGHKKFQHQQNWEGQALLTIQFESRRRGKKPCHNATDHHSTDLSCKCSVAWLITDSWVRGVEWSSRWCNANLRPRPWLQHQSWIQKRSSSERWSSSACDGEKDTATNELVRVKSIQALVRTYH